jgi:hypothetical protein
MKPDSLDNDDCEIHGVAVSLENRDTPPIRAREDYFSKQKSSSGIRTGEEHHVHVSAPFHWFMMTSACLLFEHFDRHWNTTFQGQR